MSATALLSPTESIYRARALRSWSSAQQEAVRARFAALHSAWCAEWLPAREGAAQAVDVQVSEPDAAMAPVPQDAACWSFSAASVVAPRYTAVNAIAGELFGFDMATLGPGHEAAAVATSVVRTAWADWMQRITALLEAFPVEPQEPAGARGTGIAADPWSGALCVRWSWCGGLWSLGLPHGAVAALLGDEAARRPAPVARIEAAPKQRLDQALGGEALVLRAMLAGTELNLGQLQALRLGDVLPLEHLLDAPVQIITADGTPVCDGWLGQSDGRVAVELALAAAPPSTHSSKERTNDKSH
jgi:flagellar motor switch/type III secretory pathway protein FliN